MNRSENGNVDFNQVQGILSIGQVLVSTLKFDEVMYETMRQMRELFGGEASSLLLVDEETGEVKILRMVAAHDVGRVLNPQTLKGQMYGALAQGIGRLTSP